jgi:hypothetical protein
MKLSTLYDTSLVQAYISQHANRPRWELPRAYHLASQPFLAGEREYIDALLTRAPAKVRQRWITALLARRDREHIPGWFEIMLFGWLLDIGKVQPVVPRATETPDFRLHLAGKLVAVEALCHLIPEKDRLFERRFGQLVALIHSVQRPFLLDIRGAKLPGPLKAQHFIQSVTRWLDNSSSETFTYTHDSGAVIILTAQPSQADIQHAVFIHSTPFTTDGGQLRKPLRRKADKYRSIRRRRPFVIAIFLENPQYSDYDVATALYGRTNVIIDTKAERILRVEVDRTGILYWKDTILHTSVSGVLAFTAQHDEGLARRVIRGTFLQNPFAARPIDQHDLPCRRRFIVTDRTSTHVEMKWVPDEPD